MAKKLIPVIMAIVDAVLLGVIVVSAVTGWRIGGPSASGSAPVGSTPAWTAPTSANIDSGYEPATEPPENKPELTATESPEPTPADSPEKGFSQLPYTNDIGEPKASDFAWVFDAVNGSIPDGAEMSGGGDNPRRDNAGGGSRGRIVVPRLLQSRELLGRIYPILRQQ